MKRVGRVVLLAVAACGGAKDAPPAAGSGSSTITTPVAVDTGSAATALSTEDAAYVEAFFADTTAQTLRAMHAIVDAGGDCQLAVAGLRPLAAAAEQLRARGTELGKRVAANRALQAAAQAQAMAMQSAVVAGFPDARQQTAFKELDARCETFAGYRDAADQAAPWKRKH